MRFKLLHFTSFVPMLTRLFLDPYGLKLSWCLYLFCCYVLLEHRCWNGYSVATWYNFQRTAEVAMMLSLTLSAWATRYGYGFLSVLAPFAFLLIPSKLQIRDAYYSLACLCLMDYDLFQMLSVGLMIIVGHLPHQREWTKAVTRRVVVRAVQLTTLVCAFQPTSHRIVLVLFTLLLKAVVWYWGVPDDLTNANMWKGTVPVVLDLMHIKPHTL